MIKTDELLSIQNTSRSTSANPGVLVIPKHKLAKLLSQKLGVIFTEKHLNMSIERYCHRGYGMQLVLGKKKYNLIAERVPTFLDWFFSVYSPEFYESLCTAYQNSYEVGMRGKPLRSTPQT